MFLPNLDRTPDFLDGFARAHFPDKQTIARQERNKFLKIDISGKRRLMILGRPNAVLQVTTERARTDRAQPFGVIEESEIFFDLNMPKVVPVPEPGRIHLLEKHREFALAWDLFISAPPFDAKSDVF